MKKVALTLCLAALTSGAFAQGLVNFFNTPTTLISAGGSLTATTPSAFYYALFTGPSGSTDVGQFTFSGAYGTNQATAGRFTGGGNLQIAGWTPGQTRNFFVLGWSSLYGRDATAALAIILANQAPVEGGFGGRSMIATGAAGGFDGVGTVPNLALFTSTTISSGFNMTAIPAVPEPSSFALAGLGAAALMIFRRRK